MTQAYKNLERELADWIGCGPEHVAVCSTGSAALHLAFEAVELPYGAEVVVPDLTFVACPRAVALAGLAPVFVDCGDDLLIDTSLRLPVLPAAVMPVHLYGRRCDVAAVHRYAESCGTRIVEDLAEAHGVRPHPGSDAAAWSFYMNKCVAGEEGGACWFRDPAHATMVRALRSQGYTGRPWQHLPRAVNYRMTNAQATLILNSLRMFEHNMEARWGIYSGYAERCPNEWRMSLPEVPWMYTLRVPGLAKDAQERAVAALQAAGIAARCCFWPCSWQEEFKNCRLVRGGVEHVAARMSREVVALPVQPGVTTPERVKLAFDVLEKELERKSRPLQAAGT